MSLVRLHEATNSLEKLRDITNTLDQNQQIILLAALSGASTPHRLQIISASVLSTVIKITFFGSYLLQTLNKNPNALALAWIGGLISGALNAVLADSLDPIIAHFVRSIKNFKYANAENWKENLSSFFLLLPALYLGYAQAGPFAEGTQSALQDILSIDSKSVTSQILTWLTVISEGAFLCRASYELFAQLWAKLALKDKWAVSVLAKTDTPLLCALDILDNKDLSIYRKTITLQQLACKAALFLYIVFAYALTMANATACYLKSNSFYSWLPYTRFRGVAIGAAALNLTACYTYTFFLASGLMLLCNPLLRIHNKIYKKAHFFVDSEYNFWGVSNYIAGYLLIAVSAYFSYFSSTERASSCDDDVAPFIKDVCLQYLLPMMAFIVNAGALVKLPEETWKLLLSITSAIKIIFCSNHCASTTEESKPLLRVYPLIKLSDFSASDLRELTNLLKGAEPGIMSKMPTMKTFADFESLIAWAEKLRRSYRSKLNQSALAFGLNSDENPHVKVTLVA